MNRNGPRYRKIVSEVEQKEGRGVSEEWLDGQTDRAYLSSTYLLPRHAADCATLHYLHDTALPCHAQHCTALHITLHYLLHCVALPYPTLR